MLYSLRNQADIGLINYYASHLNNIITACGQSFSQSQPDLRVFSQVLW